jgi:predicted transposase YbfD/YdcC
LRRVDREVVEAKLGAEEGIAIDGKTLRGSQKQGAPGAHLLSALAHRLGLTLAQQAVADKTNEIPVALELLRHVVLEGRVVTMDALLTQRPSAQQIVDAGGDYVRLVKDRQPQLRADIATVFALPPLAGETRTVVETVDSGHGRIEQRRVQTSDILVG